MDTVKPKPTSNRRGSPRRSARRSLHVECRHGTTGMGANLASACLDVSLSGVQVVSKDLLRLGEEVEVILEVTGIRGGLRRLGEVRWIVPLEPGGCRAGIRFDKYLTYRDLQNLSV